MKSAETHVCELRNPFDVGDDWQQLSGKASLNLQGHGPSAIESPLGFRWSEYPCYACLSFYEVAIDDLMT